VRVPVWIRVGERRVFGPLVTVCILWLGLGAIFGRLDLAFLVLATVWALWQSWRDVSGGEE
jgi:hypothetical protein